MSRSRLYWYASCTSGLGQSIAFLRQLPFNAQLLQFSINIAGGVIVSNDDFTIEKVSVEHAVYNVVLKTLQPLILGSDIVCNGAWEFRRGDAINVVYPNTDDLSVGLEMVFTEAS